MEYKNRYGDVFTFTEDEDHNILWEGNFEWCRIGMPNDYTKAYEAYLKDYAHSKDIMPLNQFKDAVHEYDDETHRFVYDKYVKMVESLKDEIDMVDPSGGCYISAGMNLGFLGFPKAIVKKFELIPTGYKIIIEK